MRVELGLLHAVSSGRSKQADAPVDSGRRRELAVISLARANLMHDWRRHFTAVAVLVLAGLLMTIQLGFVLGFMESFGAVQRQVRADLVVHPKAAPGSLFGGAFDPRHEGLVWMHPAVVAVQKGRNFGGFAEWRGAGDVRRPMQLTILDPAPDAMTYPVRFPESLRETLAAPGMLVLPRATARALGVSLGDRARLSSAEVAVGGIVDGLPSIGGLNAIVSPQTAALMSGSQSASADRFLVRIAEGWAVQQVIGQLNALLADAGLQASRPDVLAGNLGMAELLEPGPGWILMGSAFFALIVGCGIASQTLRGAFLAQLKEFGALRALGVSRRRMAFIALEQAWWTGLASIPLAALIAYGIRRAAAEFDVPIALPTGLMVGSSLLLLAVALLAGLFSLTAVTRVEPAELLR